VVGTLSPPLYSNFYYVFYHSFGERRGAGFSVVSLHVPETSAASPHTFTSQNPVYSCPACYDNGDACNRGNCTMWPEWWTETYTNPTDDLSVRLEHEGTVKDPSLMMSPDEKEIWLYYSIGGYDQTSGNDRPFRCIGQARGSTGVPEIVWETSGDYPMLCSNSENGAAAPQAAAPSVFRAEGGRMFMVFGSGGGGVYGLELNATTGWPLGRNASNPDDWPIWLDPPAPPAPSDYNVTLLATTGQRDTEAWESSDQKKSGDDVMLLDSPEVLVRETGNSSHEYYLVATYGTQYRGVDSQSQLRMGKSDNPLGPYLDDGGGDMVNGGSKLFVDTPETDKVSLWLTLTLTLTLAVTPWAWAQA